MMFDENSLPHRGPLLHVFSGMNIQLKQIGCCVVMGIQPAINSDCPNTRAAMKVVVGGQN